MMPLMSSIQDFYIFLVRNKCESSKLHAINQIPHLLPPADANLTLAIEDFDDLNVDPDDDVAMADYASRFFE